jgi:hypothetical protein
LKERALDIPDHSTGHVIATGDLHYIIQGKKLERLEIPQNKRGSSGLVFHLWEEQRKGTERKRLRRRGREGGRGAMNKALQLFL